MNTHLISLRVVLLFLVMILSFKVGATENVVKYDSLTNITPNNVFTLIGQTIIYPNNNGQIPSLPNLFWKNKKGKIYKHWGYLFTDGKEIFDKHLYITDIITLDNGKILLECNILDVNKKIYVNCDELFSTEYTVMYIDGYFKKMKELYVGELVYMERKKLPYSEQNYLEKIQAAKEYGSFRCYDVRIVNVKKEGIYFKLTNHRLEDISIDSYKKAMVSEEVVNKAKAQFRELEKREQENKRIAKLRADKIREKTKRVCELLGQDIKFTNKEKYIEYLDETVLQRLVNKWGRNKIAEFVKRAFDINNIETLADKYGFNVVYTLECETIYTVDWKRYESLLKKYGKTNAQLIIKKRPRLGWTPEMLIESIGRPNDINRSVGSWGTHEQWVYREYLSEFHEYITEYYYFENGILTTIQD